ncbi:AraC family transcriptional regulator [Paenibacillus ginsengarvi]|uniref:AraC family transcriptional regulator n=1 Tax=Paenibacillus ginsengarvi TaxID=400777 RepID=A0A3B0CJS4_9BACL|nr:AraC family transcriptional regulator [Paenibacillus ginsengarvi]RKN84529.1 AraC family transcriptional regulator [Paenibacillus ginsengarvi]
MKEIAALLGYKDVFYFSRLFKKFVGIAPNIFRNMK